MTPTGIGIVRPGYGRGTVGALVRTRSVGSTMALTAGHVVGGVRDACAFDEVEFLLANALLGTGRLASWQPVFASRAVDTTLDAAAVRIDAELAAAITRRCPLPRGWGDATAGAAVTLMGRGRRLRGRVRGRLASAYMCSSEGLRYFIADALLMQLEVPSEEGDSGAGYWDEHDRLVALHAGSAPPGCDGNTIATPIRRVFDCFDVEPVLAPGSVMRPPPPAAALPVLPPAGSQAVPVSAAADTAAIDTLARTIYGEARGEHAAGMEAVAHVVLNRRDAARWWGRTIEAVCLKPYQFSCWNDGDPNRGALLDAGPADASFAAAREIARRIVALPAAERTRSDPTGGATHYHARTMASLPNWAREHQPCARIGRHVFYRGIA